MDKFKDFLKEMGALLLVLLAALGGLIVLLIISPFFWLAVIAITLIVKLT